MPTVVVLGYGDSKEGSKLYLIIGAGYFCNRTGIIMDGLLENFSFLLSLLLLSPSTLDFGLHCQKSKNISTCLIYGTLLQKPVMILLYTPKRHMWKS